MPKGIDKARIVLMSPPKLRPYDPAMKDEYLFPDSVSFVDFVLEGGEWKLVVDDGIPSIYDAKSIGSDHTSGSKKMNKARKGLRSSQ